jgi:hypothetical protein
MFDAFVKRQMIRHVRKYSTFKNVLGEDLVKEWLVYMKRKRETNRGSFDVSDTEETLDLNEQ